MALGRIFTALALSVAALQPLPAWAQGATAASEAFPRLSVAELRKKYQDAQSRYMTIKGVEIHYKDEGPRSAPVLFMVHGSQSSVRTWDRITQLLKGRYRVIRYDIPGYGLSGPATDEAAASVQPVEIAEGFVDALGVKKLTFVGVSSGGTMGMYLAAKRPELVERLILSNTPSDPVKTDHLVQPQSFLDAQARAVKTGYQDMTFWNEYLSYFAGDPARISVRTRAEYYDFNRRQKEKHPIALVARIGDGKQAAIEMAKVKAPTLLAWGTGDPLLPESAANAIARYLSNAQISRLMMPDVGHYPPLEIPDRFARIIADYVEVVIPAKAPK
ncbi:alpha/beta hydrolase [Novosphingobium sp.]|uniref:alpha/beta fold hydrolase n=1 Tax=Novosphingobium sp. TaxID=1874826 RepID=UPI00286DC3D1|nr:alpha/beta hydrolase [Novosphingobium sp.]